MVVGHQYTARPALLAYVVNASGHSYTGGMYIKAFFVTLLTFLVVDAIWISFVLLNFYQQTLGELMQDATPGAAAVVFYLAYAAGIVLLAVRPAVDKQSLATAIGNGAALGALAYGTYTMTNFTLFGAWTYGLVISDVLWGTFLTALCAATGYIAVRGKAAVAH